MEYLMDALASVIKDPLEDPLLFEWLVIQSRGMKQWISIELARKNGICANVNYFFPRDIIGKFSLKQEFDSHLLFWKIMGLLPELIDDEQTSDKFSSIKNYLSDDKDGIRLYQLSSNIASLFDDYRIYRPDVLLKWQNNIDTFKSPHQHKGKKHDFLKWQPVLFRKMIEKGLDCSPVQLAADFGKNDLPQRISVFGISSYPPLFLSFFENLGSFIDINLFLLVPSKEFFGYSTPHFLEEIDSGNPLVTSLGKAGRDLQLLIEEFDYHEPLPDLWHDPVHDSKTILSYIQSDILNLYERKNGREKEPVGLSIHNDNSISIHSCHTPMREVQVCKDQLLSLFKNNPDLKPDDVVVMMPDIELYAPLIEAVFSVEHKFSYTISDRKQKSESETVKAFLKIINLMTSRFELHLVLDLLALNPVADKFSIDQADLSIIEKYTENAGIRWGIDLDYKKNKGFPEFNENTWQFGLQRLMLGYAMPENNDTLFCNVLASDFPEGAEAEIIGKLAFFTDTLFQGVDSFSGQNSIVQFCKCFKHILNSMITKTMDNEKDFLFILDSIQQIEKESEQALFNNEISFNIAFKILEEKLSQSFSTGSFMTGGITFCNLMPMRSIPFKVVALMGMSEQDFPRRSSSRSFDLIERFPRTGDKNLRDEDRYLFLEALISARENFIITYTGRNIKDNSPIPCSTIVSELIDVIMASFNINSEEDCICYHPLQPFSSQYFSEIDKDQVNYNQDDSNQEDSNRYFSFSAHALKISKNLLNPTDKKEVFIHKEFSTPVEPAEAISLEDLCYFFKHPLEYMIKNRLGIVLHESKTINEDREPVILNHLDNFQIGSDIIDKGIKTNQLNFDYDKFKASGKLSFGEKGRVDLEDIYTMAAPIYKKAGTIIEQEPLTSQNFDMNLNGINVTGQIDHIRKEHGRFILTFGKLNPKRILEGWIYHLALNAFEEHDIVLQTVLIGKNAKKSKEIAQKINFSEMDSKEACALLSDLVSCYQSGLNSPFVFFPETSYEFVHGFLEAGLETDQELPRDDIYRIIKKCKTKWYSPFSNTGDKINRYTDLYFGDTDLFKNIDYFISTGFIENSIRVFKPLMEHMN